MKKKSYYKRFMAMTDAQRDAAVAPFDKEDLRPGQPLTRRDKALHARAARKVGRPRIGRGSRVISLTVERELLAKADAFAKAHGMTRAAVVASGLRSLLTGAA